MRHSGITSLGLAESRRVSRESLLSLLGDGLDLEVHADEGEDKALEVLDQVVEAAQSLRIPATWRVGQHMDK